MRYLNTDIRIIDEIGVNERTIVSWYDRYNKSFSFGIFHISDRPNVLSKILEYTQWGYWIYIAPPIEDHVEASQVYDLFLKDLLAGNNWFEDDANFETPEEFQHLLEDVKKSINEIDKNNKPRHLVLVKDE